MLRRALIILTLSLASLALVGAFVWALGALGGPAIQDVLVNARDLLWTLMQILGLILIIFLAGLLLAWLSGVVEGMVVLPFENATGDSRYSGQAVSDSLVAELQRIEHIHGMEYPGIQSEELSLPRVDASKDRVTSTIADVGTVSLGKTTLSIGRLLVTIKRLWPLGDPGPVITGSLQRYGNLFRLVARREHRVVRTWEVSSVIQRDDDIPDMVRDLAYRIAKDLSGSIEAKTWQAFKAFTEALDAYHQYRETGREEDFERARANGLETVVAERRYVTAFGLLYNLAVASYNKQDYSGAEELFRKASELKSESDAFNGLGASLAEQSRHEEATAVYQRAIELDPDSAFPYNNLGNAYSNLGRDKEAIPVYQRAIELDPDSAFPHNGLGNAYDNLGRHEEAIAAYQKAIQLDPQFAFPHNGLGNAYSNLSWHEEAIAAYQRAIELDPDSAVPHNGLGNAYSNLGRNEEAIAAYQRAIELDPQFAFPHNGLGNAYSNLGRHEGAIAAYQRAIKLDPDSAFPHNGLGNAYDNLGRHEEAIGEYKRAIKLDSKSPIAHFSLARIYRKRGRDKEHAEQIRIARKFIQDESPYNRACFEAVAGNADRAIELLRQAIADSSGLRDVARRDPDLEFIRDDPRLEALLKGEAEVS